MLLITPNLFYKFANYCENCCNPYSLLYFVTSDVQTYQKQCYVYFLGIFRVKNLRKPPNPPKTNPLTWYKASVHFFHVKLLKLRKLWHKNVLRNNVTKNYEDLIIFGAVTPQLVHFLVPIYFSKFLAVNLWNFEAKE